MMLITMKRVALSIPIRSVVLALVFSGCVVAWAHAAGQNAPPKTDNTGLNRQDDKSAEPTADRQKEDRSDLKITQQIRQAITRDKSLSTYAHNVKIITQKGQVTLKGPVRSQEEKSAIEMKAIEVAGDNNVTSQLTVVPKK